MNILDRWKALLARLMRTSLFVPAVLAACLILGLVFVSIASIAETTLRETRQFSGQIPGFTEGRNSSLVPGAAYNRAGFANARTDGLLCGVSIVFLTESEQRIFLDTGSLPPPQLHCARSSAQIPGAIAAAYVENQRRNLSSWAFNLSVFDVSYPHALYGVFAIGFLLVAGVATPVLFLQRVVPR